MAKKMKLLHCRFCGQPMEPEKRRGRPPADAQPLAPSHIDKAFGFKKVCLGSGRALADGPGRRALAS